MSLIISDVTAWWSLELRVFKSMKANTADLTNSAHTSAQNTRLLVVLQKSHLLCVSINS